MSMQFSRWLKPAAEYSLAFELDLLRTILRRVGKRQAIGAVDLSGDRTAPQSAATLV
jgi:hypothetical protein